MSSSDSQNISGRDYDDGDEAGNESFTPLTGGSTFNQIDEVEHVSADTEENEGPLRTPTSTEDVSTSGRGKSPRIVVSALFPHLSPRTVEDVASALRRGGAPPVLRDPEQIETSHRPDALPAPGEASSHGARQGIHSPSAPRPPRAKVALGAKKAVAKPSSDPPVVDISAPTPTNAPSGGAAASDLPVTQGQSRRGKEKRQEPEGQSAGYGDYHGVVLRMPRGADCRGHPLAEGRAERAEKAEKEAIEKMKDASSLARFICTDEAIAKEFLTAFVNTEVGDKLVWIYG
nr:serine/arginine repetitive matrix protein 2-like [Ipomoea batatas]